MPECCIDTFKLRISNPSFWVAAGVFDTGHDFNSTLYLTSAGYVLSFLESFAQGKGLVLPPNIGPGCGQSQPGPPPQTVNGTLLEPGGRTLTSGVTANRSDLYAVRITATETGSALPCLHPSIGVPVKSPT